MLRFLLVARCIASEKQSEIGAFRGPWTPASIAWVADDVVDICPLGKATAVPLATMVLLANGRPKLIHITTDCGGQRALPL